LVFVAAITSSPSVDVAKEVSSFAIQRVHRRDLARQMVRELANGVAHVARALEENDVRGLVGLTRSRGGSRSA